MSRWVWEVMEDKTDQARIIKAEGEKTEGREDTKKKKVYETDSWERNGDNKNNRRETGEREIFDRN